MFTLLRALLWPLRSPVGRRLSGALVAIAALFWWQGDRIARWLGPPRPPEGRVGVELVPEWGGERAQELEQRFEARYGQLDGAALEAHRAALAERYERDVRAALDSTRARGEGIERSYAAGAPTALPPEVPVDAIIEVVLDPEESARTPVAVTYWLPRAHHPDLYELRDELLYLEERIAREQPR